MQLIHRRHFPFDHFVLVDEDGDCPPETLIASARREAESIALRVTGDRNKFTLIHNGGALARCAMPHVHIVCARTRMQKALIYLLIGLKNLLPARFGRRPAPQLASLP
jgi:hypothetical protein